MHGSLFVDRESLIVPQFFPVLKRGQGGFEMDGQPIESLLISLYPKGELKWWIVVAFLLVTHNSLLYLQDTIYVDYRS